MITDNDRFVFFGSCLASPLPRELRSLSALAYSKIAVFSAYLFLLPLTEFCAPKMMGETILNPPKTSDDDTEPFPFNYGLVLPTETFCFFLFLPKISRCLSFRSIRIRARRCRPRNRLSQATNPPPCPTPSVKALYAGPPLVVLEVNPC